jgi:hypothetical protein
VSEAVDDDQASAVEEKMPRALTRVASLGERLRGTFHDITWFLGMSAGEA